MLILGIETSCDETAASLLEIKAGRVKVLSNIISSQVKLHAKYGGVVPSLAAREHIKNLPKVLRLALNAKRCTLSAIDLIAVTRGPGLISSLLVGTTFAKTLAWKYNKPIIGVNHLEGHIYSNWLRPVREFSIFNFKFSKKTFPILNLVVSGGHTELVLMQGVGKYKIVGQTLDDAAGEAFDKIARILGLGYPGGPAIAATAAKLKMKNEKLKIELPRPMLNSKNFNFSFAGLKTAVLYLVRDLTKLKLSELNSDNHQSSTLIINQQIRGAIAAEAQQAIVDVLTAKTIRAAEKYKVKSIILSGGVSANKLLRTELQKTTELRDINFLKPEMEYTTDNAAMIALVGYLKAKNTKQKNSNLVWQDIKSDANLELV